jgi:ubiquinone/menaquinone biosynthesis C-methylase UbiE
MKWFYKGREQRSQWLAERFSKEIAECKSVLDVGCYMADFKKYISPDMAYTGIDMAGKPDIVINLDQINKLPFDDNAFDLVICSDVLEHLENIHLIFDELCRVSAKYIIITLPNGYADIPEFISGKRYTEDAKKRKQFGKYKKYYGLPFEKPEDRHRWFFSYDEAVEFINYRADKQDFSISLHESEKKHEPPSFRKFVFRFLALINTNFGKKHLICLLKNNEYKKNNT